MAKVTKRQLPQLQDQLQGQRRKVDYDTFDIVLQQIMTMVSEDTIQVAPAYQRQFRWGEDRCSSLIESIFLGIPIPSLFMATNLNSTWELVDGVQRISAIVKFAGDKSTRSKLGLNGPLRLTDLEKLTEFNGLTFSELPSTLQLHFETRPLKVVTLSDKSDEIVRFDLFERLNTGGVELSKQEIRDCVYRGDFADFLEELGKNEDFRSVVRLTSRQQKDGTREECVLRFFAFKDRYKSFLHSVEDFLNDYMGKSTKTFKYGPNRRLFENTFRQLAKAFPDGIRRPGARRTTPLNLYEGVAVGAALAIKGGGKLHVAGIKKWMGSNQLLDFTTGATNSPKAVKGRIEFCRDRFLGK